MPNFFQTLNKKWTEGQLAQQSSNQTIVGQQPALNQACKFRDFGWYTPSTAVFYTPTSWSGLPPDVKICQECFASAIEPCKALSDSWAREDTSSSSGEEAFVQCLLAQHRLEAPWLQSVRQANAAPFIAGVKRLKELDSQSDEKCPSTNADSQDDSTKFWTLTNLPAEQDGRRFKICEHHYAAYVQDTWIEGEFSPLPVSQRGNGICDYGSHSGARLALLYAQRNSNTKIFHDWAALYIGTQPCRGIIGARQHRFVLSGFDGFVACRTCYDLSVGVIPSAQSMFQKTSSPRNDRCVLADKNKSIMWSVGLIQADWKGNRQEFVDTVRKGLQTPPCPLLGDKDKMALQSEWYSFKSDTVTDMIITSCEACFLRQILPTNLATSFALVRQPHPEIVGCDLAHPGIRSAFDAAKKEGNIAAFERNLQQLLESSGSGGGDSGGSSQQSQQQGGDGLPDIDISGCRGTPQQVAALQQLQQEVIMMRRIVEVESNRARMELQQAAFDESNALTMQAGWGIAGTVSYASYQDGHGGWFDTRQGAQASAQHKMAMQRLRFAQSRNAELIAKTNALLRMKAQLTPRY